MFRKVSLKIGNKEFSLSFILSVSSSIIGAIFSILAAKFLGSNQYGQIQYYVSIVSFLSVFMLFGTDNYVIKNAQFEKNKQDLASKSTLFVFLLSSLVLPIYFRIANSMLTKLNGNTFLITIIFVFALLLTLSTLGCSFLQAKNKYQTKLLFSSFIPHAGLLILLLVHYVTNTMDKFASFYLVYYGVLYGAYGVFFFIKNFFPISSFFKLDQLKSILFFGLTWIFYNLTTPISNIIIGEKYETFGIVGIFSLSSQLLTISGLATGIISQISNTTFAKLSKEKDVNKIFANYERITRITIYISIPFYAAFIAEADNIMNFFGDSYTGYNLILILLTISSLIECITGPCGSLLLMNGKEKENFFASFARCFVFLLLLFTLINYTIYAAPISMIISTTIANLLKLIFLYRYYHKNFFSRKIYLVVLVLFVVSFGIFFGLSFIKNPIIWAIVNGIVGISIIFGAIVLTPFKDDKKYFTKGKEI